MKKKAAVTIETERLLVIRARGHAETWCPRCAARASMIAVREAAAVAGISERRIFQLGESGAIHFTETADGKTFFCVPSILKQRDANARALPRPTKSR
ncbi:MAG TPA: hypothetical protein VGJ69_04870 [Pyrinomonadaceae bacterium]